MRRLTLQFDVEELLEHQGMQLAVHRQETAVMTELDSFEIVHILKQDEKEMAMIARMSFKDKKLDIRDLFGDELSEYQLLETDKDGTRTYFLKSKHQDNPDELDSILGFGGYLTEPFSIRGGKATMTFLGSAAQLRRILKAIDSFKIPYKILALSDAKFSHDSPLSTLTEKQRRIIVSAFNSGYYDIPRRISSESLAEKLEIRAPTLVMHRRKAEQRILRKIIND